ncbi:MAG: helix-turn-helix transcriptional regulator [Turicibacter sp.]|nr:helix-turn-helix transcriptional regulator [Turicibacter sp.]
MSNNLKVYRIKFNLTQKQLAKIIGVSTQTYVAWEANPGMIRNSHANKIADFFGVTLDDIFRT